MSLAAGLAPAAHAPRILVVGHGTRLAHAQRLGEAIAAAVPRWRVGVAGLGGAHPLPLAEPVDALLILHHGPESEAERHALAAAAEERGIPVLHLAAPPHAPTGTSPALVESADAAPAFLAGVVQGMLARQTEVWRLQQELNAVSQVTGGLRGEIHRMQEELQLASQVQREFLPRDLPSLLGVGMAALWRPAGWVSGDIYAAQRLDEHHLGVLVADAMGHGVPAALLTMILCRGLPTKETRGRSYRIIPPGEALARVNDDLVGIQQRATRFVTAVYAVIDCRTRSVTLAGAGHPAPLILRAAGGMEKVPCLGGVLGLFEHERFPEQTIQLAEGDRLLIHSDGFEGLFAGPDPPGGPSGDMEAALAYLPHFQALAPHADAESIVEAMAARVDQHLGSLHQSDDLTLVAIHAGRASA